MFDTWLRELRDRPVDRLDRRELCDAAAASAWLRAGLDAFDARVGAAVQQLDDGGPGASVVFRGASRCSQREADRRARRAEALLQLPSAAEALASGAITAEHVDTLTRAAQATTPESVEQSGLVRTATQRPADLFGNDVRDWTRRHQSQSSLKAAQKRRREARRCVVFEGDDGMTVIHAEFDPITGARIKSAIDTATDRLFHADGGRPAAGEQRTPAQRRADALYELLIGLADGPTDTAGTARGAAGPVRTQLLVIAHADGTAEIPGVGPIPASELTKLVCTSDLFGIVFSTDGQPLWHGTRVRLADDNQWRALIARDRGCVICDAHPSKCEAHHVIFAGYPSNGPTDIDNLVLVCSHHHHLIHDQRFLLRQRADGSWEVIPPEQPRAGP